MYRAWLALAVLAALCAVSTADSLTYENSRFGTRISFPSDVFDVIDPPPANGDGRLFRSADGAELAVYGQHNALDRTPDGMLASARSEAAGREREVTYGASGKDWVVISGYEDGTVFYERHEFGANDTIHSMVLRYPEARKTIYDGLAGAIAGTLEGP